MEGKSDPLDINLVLIFKPVNTPGNEITPGSDVVGKDFENNRVCHALPPFVWLRNTSSLRLLRRPKFVHVIKLSPAPLRPAQASLESSEGSEKKIVADPIGSLKKPCETGRPDTVIGTNGEILEPRIGSLVPGSRTPPLSL